MERLQKQEKTVDASESAFDETEEYVKAAKILGRSFLQGKVKKEEIGEKLERYPEQSRTAALQALTEELAANMSMENSTAVLETIRYLKKDEQTKEICAGAEALHGQYESRLEENLAQLAETTTQQQLKDLSRKGIKGSAIAGFNVKKTATWQQLKDRTEEEYRGALETFRRAIKSS